MLYKCIYYEKSHSHERVRNVPPFGIRTMDDAD